jgi:hypothetical protein
MLLRAGDWAVTIDISQAYHHVPVNANIEGYLAFQHSGRYFVYQGTPFGVSTAPRVFSKIMHHCATVVRMKWRIRCVQYLDDWLLLDRSRRRVRRIALLVVTFLKRLG